jgi:hypothetical protein
MLFATVVTNGGNAMKKSLAVLLTFAAILMIPACRKNAPAGAAQPAVPAAPGRITAEIKPSAIDLGANQTYSVDYLIRNGSSARLKIQRLALVSGVLNAQSPGWRQSEIEPGQTATVAQVSARTPAAGPVRLTASFVTDQGAIDAPPVQLNVAAATPAPAFAGTVRAVITAAPNPVKAGQPCTVNYELIDSTNQDVLVASIHTDSSQPYTRDSDGWLSDRAGQGSRVTIFRRNVTRPEPGSYTFTAQFNTNEGMIPAQPLTLVIEPAVQVVVDTGHVSVAIAITPNPAHIDQPYMIDYQVINSTTKPVNVTAVQTDIGTYAEGSPEWVSGTAGPNMTTVVARLSSTGGAIGGRTKTAVFSTSAGMLPAAPVVLTVGQ